MDDLTIKQKKTNALLILAHSVLFDRIDSTLKSFTNIIEKKVFKKEKKIFRSINIQRQ